MSRVPRGTRMCHPYAILLQRQLVLLPSGVGNYEWLVDSISRCNNLLNCTRMRVEYCLWFLLDVKCNGKLMEFTLSGSDSSSHNKKHEFI